MAGENDRNHKDGPAQGGEERPAALTPCGEPADKTKQAAQQRGEPEPGAKVVENAAGNTRATAALRRSPGQHRR